MEATLNPTASSSLGLWLAWPDTPSDGQGPCPWEGDHLAWAGRISELHGAELHVEELRQVRDLMAAGAR